MNYVTLKAALDLASDEPTWGFEGFMAEVGWRLINKPFSKGEHLLDNNLFAILTLLLLITGGQTVLVTDVDRRYPRLYYHRHKLNPKPQGFTQLPIILGFVQRSVFLATYLHANPRIDISLDKISRL